MPESKSKTESTPAPEPKPEAREPRALSNEYHKARKQLMLWAGILFIWELVGVDLDKAKEAGGNFGAIIGAIKSPQAVPWALLILVAYFAFKLRIEWGQCNVSRRLVRESRVDYYSGFVVAAAACALYFGQTISHIQFANAIQGSSRFGSVFAGGSLIFFVISLHEFVWKRRSRIRTIPDFAMAFLLPVTTLLGGAYIWRIAGGGANRWHVVGIVGSLLTVGMMSVLHERLIEPRLRGWAQAKYRANRSSQ